MRIDSSRDLEEIFENQKTFQKILGLPTHYVSRAQKCKDALVHLLRAQGELKEAQDEIPVSLGGMTKMKGYFNIDDKAVCEELADAFLFMVNTMNILGISLDQFLIMCLHKQNKNIDNINNKHRFRYEADAPVIIIDGPDGLGKTQICNELAKHYKLPVVRMETPAYMMNIEVAAKTFNETVFQFNTPMILDRGFPSSIVYGEYFHRNVDMIFYDQLARSDRNFLVFIIDAEKPFREDDYIDTIEKWNSIRQLYLEAAKTYSWKIIPNSDSLENCVQQIIDVLQF